MIKQIKNIDTFDRNIILVFIGTSFANLLNLLYQLLIAHRLSSDNFAAFNSLLSIFMLISSPLGTFQAAIAKYSAEFSAQNQTKKIKILLFQFLKNNFLFAIATFFIFYFSSSYLTDKLKVYSVSSGHILAVLFALWWITPLFLGAIQGLELFKWFVSITVIVGLLKLFFAHLFIIRGLDVNGALGALLLSALIGFIISLFALRNFIDFKTPQDGISITSEKNEVNFKEIIFFMFPLAISVFCFMGLVNFDMILVRYFFIPQDSGSYSLAQMVGKIFLFLPASISIVMFPRTSGLNAKNQDTSLTLKRSLFYAAGLCILAALIYNSFPSFVLKVLTGKVNADSIILGRLFSVSMTFFTLLYILIAYLLSIKDLRFIRHLILFTCLQFFSIILFHKSLLQVQLVLCVNSVLLFFIHLNFVCFKKY
ncbi:MAG: oligosaccharide flippase family protein [Candidatus Omnitrophica bacterium]|nr:oligosaccharide flippase family protein [Candidatus Omnitrophota bacterium]